MVTSIIPTSNKNFDDYLNYSQIIKPILKMHIQSILQVGSNVVMDFPGNTRKQRAWLLSIANEIHANHQLIYLNLADEQCLKQLKKEPIKNLIETHLIRKKPLIMYPVSLKHPIIQKN